ncbi:MAG: hypothetical protein Wins2KO_22830 [Winogradskyella sp.]
MLCNINIASGQCEIPNGNFDNFSPITNGSFVNILPDSWTESQIINNFPRTFFGRGFFNKYEEDDAVNGVALKLKRSHVEEDNMQTMSKGYIHYPCDQIPNKLRGKYKLRGAGNYGEFSVVDTLKIVVKFSTLENPVELGELELSEDDVIQIEGNKKVLNLTAETQVFQEFELDLEDLIDVPSDFVSIHLILKQGDFGSTGLPLSFNFSEAVLDDLEFIYEPSLILEENKKNEVNIWPNPTNDILHLNSKEELTSISLYDLSGRLVKNQNINYELDTSIDLSGYSAGIYFLHITGIDNKQDVFKITKN